jgi:hypothetical protein
VPGIELTVPRCRLKRVPGFIRSSIIRYKVTPRMDASITSMK